MEPATFLPIHKDSMIFQNQAIEAEMRNIKGQGLGYIVHHLVHGLTRQGINQIDGDIVKTSGLEAVNGFINLAFIVAATDPFQHLVVKGLNAQRNPIAGWFFQNRNLIGCQITRIGFNGKFFQLGKIQFISQVGQQVIQLFSREGRRRSPTDVKGLEGWKFIMTDLIHQSFQILINRLIFDKDLGKVTIVTNLGTKRNMDIGGCRTILHRPIIAQCMIIKDNRTQRKARISPDLPFEFARKLQRLRFRIFGIGIKQPPRL